MNMKRQKDLGSGSMASNQINPENSTNNLINNHNGATEEDNVLFTISGRGLYKYMVALPLFAALASVALSLIKDFERSVWTACRVSFWLRDQDNVWVIWLRLWVESWYRPIFRNA